MPLEKQYCQISSRDLRNTLKCWLLWYFLQEPSLIVLQTIEWTFLSSKPFLACKPRSRRAPVLLKVILKVCRKTISFLDVLAYCRKYFFICPPACRPLSASDSLDFIPCDIFIYLAAALLCLVQHLHHGDHFLLSSCSSVFGAWTLTPWNKDGGRGN